jgi:hypothetical protein
VEESPFLINSEDVITLPPDVGAGSQFGKHNSLRMNVGTCNSPSRQISVQLTETHQYPITIEDGKMVVLPQLMRTERLYTFTYANETLLVKRTRDGKIVIYEVVENASQD